MTPRTVALQGSLSLGFSGQEYWSGLPDPPPGELPDPVIEVASPASPALQESSEMWVCSLGWQDPVEEEMATHSSILAWEIPWTEEPGGLQSTGSQTVGLKVI